MEIFVNKMLNGNYLTKIYIYTSYPNSLQSNNNSLGKYN
jgi:hypothetical protein